MTSRRNDLRARAFRLRLFRRDQSADDIHCQDRGQPAAQPMQSPWLFLPEEICRLKLGQPPAWSFDQGNVATLRGHDATGATLRRRSDG